MTNEQTQAVSVADEKSVTKREEFELKQRQAQMLSKSTLVPKSFRGNLPDIVIAINMAERMKADVLSVMQNMHVIHGKPSFSAAFLIATFNTCGNFSSIRYEMTGKGDSRSCVASATDLRTGEVCTGPEVSIKIAKAEGWYDKAGSKWKNMPELMLRYRAAAWFVRTTAPELSMGLTFEEQSEIAGQVNAKRVVVEPSSTLSGAIQNAMQAEVVGNDIGEVGFAEDPNPEVAPKPANGELFEQQQTYE